MKIYLFDPTSRVLLKENKARTGDVPGSWYIPLNSTHIPPPEENRDSARWNGFEWEIDGQQSQDDLYTLNPTGTYHLPTCGYASENGEALTLAAIREARPDAKPCSRCNPPAL